MEAKIGQKTTITEDFEIQGCFGDHVIQVKQGDTGFVDCNGFIHYETGKARGKIQKFDDISVKGYDSENIAKLILNRLSGKFNLKEFLDGHKIEEKEIADEIEDVLSEIF